MFCSEAADLAADLLLEPTQNLHIQLPLSVPWAALISNSELKWPLLVGDALLQESMNSLDVQIVGSFRGKKKVVAPA